MSSCDLFSTKSTKTTQRRPSTQKPSDRPTDKDKEVIVIDKGTKGTPVNDKDKVVVEVDKPHKKSSYSIEMYVPIDKQYFDTDKESLSSKNEHYIQFVLGAALAAEEWKQKGAQVNIDIKKSSEFSTRSYDGIGQGPDIIIGGESGAQIKEMAQLAAEKQISVISPFIPRSDVTTSNPFFIQAMPDLESYCKAMTIDAMKSYPNADFHILGPESVSERFSYFQNAKASYEGVSLEKLERFKESIIDEESIGLFDNAAIGNKFTQVFFIPLDRDKTYLYKLLTQLSTLEDKRNFVVYGIPPWDRYDVLFQFFEPLEIHLAKHASIYGNTPQFKDFERTFYQKYNILANSQAAYGYDLMNVLIETIDKEGVPVYTGLMESRNRIGVGSRWDFQPVISKSSGQMKAEIVEYIKNEGILIID